MTSQQTGGLKPTRRTLVKGAAWSVPVVAMAGPAHAVTCSPGSCPPPPAFDFINGYKNPGNSCTSDCVPMQSYGTPVTVSNPSDEDYYIQFTSYTIGTTNVGVYSVVTSLTACTTSNLCEVGTCNTTSTNTVCVPAGTPSLTIWVTSGNYGSSPNSSQSIDWQWIRKSDCSVTDSGNAFSPDAPPDCSGSPTNEGGEELTTSSTSAVDEEQESSPRSTDQLEDATLTEPAPAGETAPATEPAVDTQTVDPAATSAEPENG